MYKRQVYERTCDAVVNYQGSREAVICGIRAFHYQDVEAPQQVLQSSGRALNAEYQAVSYTHLQHCIRKRNEDKKVDLMAVSVNIEKNFRDFSLKVQFEGSSAAIGLLGASGSGKSMTLRCIAGIETPDRGKIVINGKTVFDSEAGINLKPQKRRIGYLFQNYALFPTMTVEQLSLIHI